MKKIILIFSTFFFLSGCMMNAAEQRAAYDREDHNKCIEYGFKVGTNEYSNCKISLDQMRAQTQRANNEKLGSIRSCLLVQSGWSDTSTTLGSSVANCQ